MEDLTEFNLFLAEVFQITSKLVLAEKKNVLGALSWVPIL